MRYRQLGASDLMVSEIGLGSWLTYGAGVGTERGIACVRRAFEVGINFFDTANVYGGGAAETFLGQALSGVDRDSYILGTKAFFPMPDGDRGLSAAQIRKQADASLQRLRTDYVDLYQCHRYDPDTPLEETMEALTDLVRQGKARWLGFSEWTADQVSAALALPGVERFVSSQPEYSMLWRKPEPEIFPLSGGRASARSCGRRWPRALSPASTSPAPRRPPGPAPPTTRWGRGWAAGATTRC